MYLLENVLIINLPSLLTCIQLLEDEYKISQYNE